MNRITLLLLSSIVITAGVACSSTTTGSSGDGGTPGTSSTGATTLACFIALNGFQGQCQFYEATGADAPAVVAQLRAGCVDQASAKAHVLDACSATDTLGGCKTPVKVQGAADVNLFVTNFEYVPSADAGTVTHKTATQVESFCKSQGNAVYVASP